MGLPVIGLFVKGATHTIGYVKEASVARKEARKTSLDQRKSSPMVEWQPRSATIEPKTKNPSLTQVTYVDYDFDVVDSKNAALISSSEDGDEDEAECAFDEMSSRVQESISETETVRPEIKKRYGINSTPTIESLVASVSAQCVSPLRNDQLRCPVIIPQRRPGDKDRGFIHAYAPDLADFGIPQDAFISFLKHFHTATQASKILNVVYISAGIVGLVPHVAASTVVQVAAGMAMDLQKRHRTNSFLDEMNERVFKPRRLFAVIMCYKPEGAKPMDARQLDVESLVLERAQALSDFGRAMKLYDGDTYGDIEMPQSVPLVFPVIDEKVLSISDVGPWNMNCLKNSQKFLSDYQDKRAQAIFSAKNPTSTLRLQGDQAPVFTSRFSDPTDPIHDGSLITLIKSGLSNSKSISTSSRPAATYKRQAKQLRKAERHAAKHGISLTHAPEDRKGRGGGRGMKKGVLYLMIVDLPHKTQVADAMSTIENYRKEG